VPVRIPPSSPVVLVAPDAAVSVDAGEAVVDLSAIAGATTSDLVSNESDMAGATVTNALDSADSRITTAQATADQAVLDAAAAQAAADAAQLAADAAQATADAAVASGTAPELLTVRTLSDFPTPVAGVITLTAPTKALRILQTINLGANRLVVPNDFTILGIGGAESGLQGSNAAALITGKRLVTLDMAVINAAGPSARVAGTVANDPAAGIRANGCVFVGASSSGAVQIHDADLGSFFQCSWQSCTGVGVRATGGIRAAFAGACQALGNAASFTWLQVPAGTTVSGRVVVSTSSFDLASGGVGVDVDPAAMQIRGLQLNSCLFPDPATPGVGTPATGTTAASTKGEFFGNVNVENTHFRGGMSIADNAMATTVSNTTDYFVLSGTTTLAVAQLFDSPAAGRLRYIGTGTIRTKATAFVTLTTGSPNQDLQVIFVRYSAGGTPSNLTVFIAEDVTDGTTLRTGIIPLMVWPSLAAGESLAVAVRNKTASNNVTWLHGQVYVEQING
jgi:hypothetical protein